MTITRNDAASPRRSLPDSSPSIPPARGATALGAPALGATALGAPALGALALGDLRFRALVRDDDWARLPLPIRRRFSKRLAATETAVYVGVVHDVFLSRAGWALAQAARLIGAPLPTSREIDVPSIVTVTEAAAGQIWTRLYARRNAFPQKIHSAKRFCGPTGLEEYLGFGLGMALTLQVENAALVFRSRSYFVAFGRRRLMLPAWLGPGALAVTHAELGDGRFMFTLELKHPWLGLLIRQSASFRETSFQEYRP